MPYKETATPAVFWSDQEQEGQQSWQVVEAGPPAWRVQIQAAPTGPHWRGQVATKTVGTFEGVTGLLLLGKQLEGAGLGRGPDLPTGLPGTWVLLAQNHTVYIRCVTHAPAISLLVFYFLCLLFPPFAFLDKNLGQGQTGSSMEVPG